MNFKKKQKAKKGKSNTKTPHGYKSEGKLKKEKRNNPHKFYSAYSSYHCNLNHHHIVRIDENPCPNQESGPR
jgi:hypothetical protein